MVVSEEYMNELLKYDFTSTKKGRGLSSILLHKKERKQKGQQQQHQDEGSQILQPPAGVMDVKRWHD